MSDSKEIFEAIYHLRYRNLYREEDGMIQYSIGVDIGVDITRLGIFFADGAMEDKWEIATECKKGCKSVLKNIVYSINKTLEAKKIGKKNVIGIGVSIPGTVNEAGIADYCAELGWGIVNVKELLVKLCDLPVTVGNKANMAALGERWMGASKGSSNSIAILLDRQIGCGIIANGSLILGNRGLSGEIGSMTICTIVRPGGNIRCRELNEYASEKGIIDAYQYSACDGQAHSFPDEAEITSNSIFEAGKAGDPLAQKIINEFGWGIACALINLVLVIDPEVIVIGGEISEKGAIVLNCIEKYFKEKTSIGKEKVIVILSKLGRYAAVYGSAKYVMNSLESSINIR